jgi:hypothetical protein
MTTKVLLLTSVSAFLSLLSQPTSLNAQTPSPAAVIEATERREKRILDASCRSEETLVGHLDLKSPNPNLLPLRQEPVVPRVEKSGAGFRLRFFDEKRKGVNPDGSLVTHHLTQWSDGEKLYSYYPDYKSGTIGEITAPEIARHDLLLFQGFSFDPQNPTLSARLTNAWDLKVRTCPAPVNGEKTCLVEIQERNPRVLSTTTEALYQVFLWLVPEKAFAPVRIGQIESMNGKPTFLYRRDVTAFAEPAPGLFLPCQGEKAFWRLSLGKLLGKNGPSASEVFNLAAIPNQDCIEGYQVEYFDHHTWKGLELKVNQGMTQSEILFQFPEGTSLFDERKKVRYVRLSDPEKETEGGARSSTRAHEPLAPAKSALRILYAGYPDSPRGRDFVSFLTPFFQEVKAVNVLEFDEKATTGYSVVIIDNDRYSPQSREPPRPKLSEAYAHATITIGVPGSCLCGDLRLKTGYS